MVRVREARRAFREFRATCFWSYRKDLEIGPDDVDWVAETMRKNGDMRAWRAAERLCLAPTSRHFSEDIDFFHDSAEAVAEAFERDSAAIKAAGYRLRIALSQPGHIRAVVERGDQTRGSTPLRSSNS